MAVAGVACVGLGLLGAFLPAPADREAAAVQRRADRAMLVLAGAWLALALLSVAFRAADAFGRPVTALTVGQMLRWATELAAGRGMVLAAGCAAVVVGCAIVRLRPGTPLRADPAGRRAARDAHPGRDRTRELRARPPARGRHRRAARRRGRAVGGRARRRARAGGPAPDPARRRPPRFSLLATGA